MVERFHVGQRVRLTRALTTEPRGLFPKGATGTVTDVKGIMVWIRMKQHFPHLRDNVLAVKHWEITARPRGLLPRLLAAWWGD